MSINLALLAIFITLYAISRNDIRHEVQIQLARDYDDGRVKSNLVVNSFHFQPAIFSKLPIKKNVNIPRSNFLKFKEQS